MNDFIKWGGFFFSFYKKGLYTFSKFSKSKTKVIISTNRSLSLKLSSVKAAADKTPVGGFGISAVILFIIILFFIFFPDGISSLS